MGSNTASVAVIGVDIGKEVFHIRKIRLSQNSDLREKQPVLATAEQDTADRIAQEVVKRGTWSPSWNRSSMKAPMDIDRAARRLRIILWRCRATIEHGITQPPFGISTLRTGGGRPGQ